MDFTFPSEPQKQILHKLSFVADAGSKVAFVGATGCGKSTQLPSLLVADALQPNVALGQLSGPGHKRSTLAISFP